METRETFAERSEILQSLRAGACKLGRDVLTAEVGRAREDDEIEGFLSVGDGEDRERTARAGSTEPDYNGSMDLDGFCECAGVHRSEPF